MRIRTRNSLFLSAALAALSGSAVAVAANGPEPSNESARYAAQQAGAIVETPVQAVDPELAQSFRLLRGRPELVPGEVRMHFEQDPTFASFGLNLDLAQAAQTGASPQPIWVVPGKGVACVWIKDPIDGAGISCDPVDRILRNGLLVTLVKPGEPNLTVAGIIPDGVNVPRLTGDASKALPEDAAAFGATDVPAEALTFRKANDTTATVVPLVRPDGLK